jgi:threonine dehydrogenase-like Zn-dependent dehydrogenase
VSELWGGAGGDQIPFKVVSMKAVWLEDRTVFLKGDMPDPRPSADEALIRIEYAGICSTDHGLIRGMYPFIGIPGHEFVGRVEDGPQDLLGKRVVGVISVSCLNCPTCRRGRTGHCPNRTVLGIQDRNGAFAQYTTLPVVNLHVVPDALTAEKAVFVEPLAAALEILEQVHIRPTDRVLLIGPGKLGQLVARVLAMTPCAFTVAARSAHSLDRLPQNIVTCHPDEVESAAFDIVVECTGNASGFGVARRAVRPAGTLVLKSTHGYDTNFDLTMAVVDEVTVVGSRCGPFSPAIELLASGRVDPSPLVDATFELDDAMKAIDVSQDTGVFKVLMTCAT